jgi:hypothetical protein
LCIFSLHVHAGCRAYHHPPYFQITLAVHHVLPQLLRLRMSMDSPCPSLSPPTAILIVEVLN